MQPIDYIVIAIICVAVGLAVGYIIREKKRGKKCIGCPYSSSCSGSAGCSCGAKKEQ